MSVIDPKSQKMLRFSQETAAIFTPNLYFSMKKKLRELSIYWIDRFYENINET